MKELYEGIYSHFNTVNTLNTALSGNLYPHEAPQQTDFPYGVYYKISGTPDFTFTEDFEDMQIQISVFSDDRSPVEINNLFGYLKALFDDAGITVTGYDVVRFQRMDDVLLRDEEMGTWAYHVTYEVTLEKLRG